MGAILFSCTTIVPFYSSPSMGAASIFCKEWKQSPGLQNSSLPSFLSSTEYFTSHMFQLAVKSLLGQKK